jgi:beta-glucosidase
MPGLDFYDRLVDTLLAHNIVPLATLYHWDLPLALHEQGGWLNRDTAYAFADYTAVVAQRLGDRINHWITHNEPWCNAFLGYGLGVHAPGLADMQSAINAGHYLLLGHGLALPRLRALTRPEAQLGITLNLGPIYGITDDPNLEQGIEQKDILHNRWFLDPIFRGQYPEQLFTNLEVQPPPIEGDDMALISTPLDFLGVNYYTRIVLQADTTTNPVSYPEVKGIEGSQYTAMNWEVYPQGLTDLLLRLHREYAPGKILITENGAAYDDQWHGEPTVADPLRVEYLQTHIQAVGRALAEGVPVHGYYVWSLMDNYEWAEGYSKRFGIIYIDYESQQRILKESARWYQQFLQTIPAQNSTPPSH